MEFVAKLDDQVSAPAETAAAGLDKASTATKAFDEKLRKLDVAQQRSQRSAEAMAKAFSPEVYQKQAKAEEELRLAKQKALQGLGMGLSDKEKEDKKEKEKEFNPEVYQKQAKAEEELRAAKEKALQGLKMGLSEKEKDAEKDAEKAKEKAKNKYAGLATAAKGAALSMLAVAGASSAMDLAKVAIGVMGMARLQMIGQRAQLLLKGLFKGVDSKPLERSFMRLTDLLNVATPTGKALSGILTRGFNSFFKAIEAATPYIEAFAQGIVIAGLLIEIGWLKARLALMPLTQAMGGAVDKTTLLRVAAIAGGAAVLALGYTAVAAAAPFLGIAATIGLAVTAVTEAIAAFQELDEYLGNRDKADAERDSYNKMLDKEAADRKAAGKPSMVVEGDVKAAAAAQPANGAAIGDGLVAGMKSKEAEVRAAGVALAMAADQGVKAGAQIKSPSKLLRREARYMGEGVELGLEDSAPGVQRAAEQGLVPQLGGAPAGRRAGGAGGAGGLPPVQFNNCTFGAGVNPGSVRAEIDQALAVLMQALAARMGVA